VLSTEDLVPERPAAWAKVRLIQELLASYEYVFWIDSDALFVDVSRNVLDEVASAKPISLVEHPQNNADGPVVPNSGVLLVRNCSFTIDFLQRLWDSTEFIEHNWWENAALLALLGHSLEPPWPLVHPTPDRDGIGILDLAWNSVPDVCEAAAPVIMHHARANQLTFESRLAGMTSDLERFWTRGIGVERGSPAKPRQP
jgi:hypothetical protein